MVVLRPSRGADGGPELLVGAMGALAYDRGRRSEHRGSLLDAEPFLLEEHVRDPVLLRHPAQLERQDLLHIASSNRSRRRAGTRQAPRAPALDPRTAVSGSARAPRS